MTVPAHSVIWTARLVQAVSMGFCSMNNIATRLVSVPRVTLYPLITFVPLVSSPVPPAMVHPPTVPVVSKELSTTLNAQHCVPMAFLLIALLSPT